MRYKKHAQPIRKTTTAFFQSILCLQRRSFCTVKSLSAALSALFFKHYVDLYFYISPLAF